MQSGRLGDDGGIGIGAEHKAVGAPTLVLVESARQVEQVVRGGQREADLNGWQWRRRLTHEANHRIITDGAFQGGHVEQFPHVLRVEELAVRAQCRIDAGE